MDILLIEQKKTELINNIINTASPRKRLLFIYLFFDLILHSNNEQIINSYLPEFIEKYIIYLDNFEIYGLSPAPIDKIVSQCQKLSELKCIEQYHLKLRTNCEKFRGLKKDLLNILNGKTSEDNISNKLYFPLIEESEIFDNINLGLLETITVQIKEEKDETKFHITPSGKEIEKRIKGQVEISWAAAVKFIKKNIPRLKTNHSVFVQFDHHYGEYVGDSLGAALTLTFMSELHRFYNSKFQIKYNGKIAITGALDNELNIFPISEKNIIKKTEIVFYSDADVFVVSEEEKTTAQNKLEMLKTKYPKRKLKIIGVEDFLDLLDRRSILEVHKQKLIVRSAKYAKKNWVTVLLILLFSAAFHYTFINNNDRNPSFLDKSGKYILIKNKSGKVLWRKQFYSYVPENNVYVGSIFERIIDLDDDGINEVLMVNQIEGDKDYGTLNFYDFKGKSIWEYKFKDSISTNTECFKPYYEVNIAGVDSLNGEKILYLIANQKPYYPSAIFRIRAKDAVRLPGTFWHPGRITTALLNDIDNDGVKELICSATNNEWEGSVVFTMNKDSLYGRGPAIYKYVFPGKKLYNFINYLMIPKSDIALYQKMRYPIILTGNFTLSEQRNLFFNQVNQSKSYNVQYVFEKNLRITDVIISDLFRVERDSLVSQGKLSLPLTDTPKYRNILKNQIRYWNGEKFVTEEKYFENE